MDKERFIEVITTHRNLIFKICNSYCPNSNDREDLEQEILLQLWNSFEKFNGNVKMSTWIYRIALNTAITHYRKDTKRIDKPVDFDHRVFYLPDYEYDPQIDKMISVLYSLLDQLSKLDKALMLLYLDNYKHKEIADILGISESNVATKVSRIKQHLKNQFVNEKK